MCPVSCKTTCLGIKTLKHPWIASTSKLIELPMVTKENRSDQKQVEVIQSSQLMSGSKNKSVKSWKYLKMNDRKMSHTEAY